MSGKIELNTLKNANIYINGNCLLGRADEIKLPEIKLKMVEHKALGMVGTIKLPGGLEALEGEIKWNSFYEDVWEQVLDPYTAVQLQVRGNLETHGGAGRIAQKTYTVMLSVQFDSVALGTFKQNDNAEFPSKFYASYIKQQVAGQDVIEFDVMANIWKKKGKDMLEQYRNNVGA
jgi:P2 family phage contractile tail tube protein